MKILPASGSEWLAVSLIPFKVFVPVGYLTVLIQQNVLSHRGDKGEIVTFVLDGYLITFLVLVLGATVQSRIGPRKAYVSTCVFIIALLVFGLMLLPYLAHT